MNPIPLFSNSGDARVGVLLTLFSDASHTSLDKWALGASFALSDAPQALVGYDFDEDYDEDELEDDLDDELEDDFGDEDLEDYEEDDVLDDFDEFDDDPFEDDDL